MFLPTADSETAPTENEAARYAPLAPMFTHCDLVLVEGDSQTTAPKVEIWRAEVGSRPIAESDAGVLAVVTDDCPDVAAETLSRADLPALADWILKRLDVANP